MNEKNNPIIKSLTEPSKTFFRDIAELGLDELLKKIASDMELLQKIPVIKWLFIANDVRNIFQRAFFIKKYANFIGPVNESIQSDFFNEKKLNDLLLNKKDFTKIVEQTILTIDRYQTEIKSKLLGILFVCTFKDHLFSIREYNTLLFSIEFMHPYNGLDCLNEFYKYRNDMETANNESTKNSIWSMGRDIDYSPLANTGFLNLPKGGAFAGDLGGAFLNNLGKKFYELVVNKIK
jgi:hypothetical protein